VLLVPARGGQPRIVTRGLPGSAYPTFSRDGRWIYFAAESRVWKMAATGGAPVQVTNSPGFLAIESYAGDLFYIDSTFALGAVWRLPQQGGPAVKVIEGVVRGNFDVAEEGIYYVDRVTSDGASSNDRPDGGTRLRYFAFATSQSTTVATDLGTIGLGLSVTRDGRTVFFSRIDASVDELMLVDDFR
jgi:hypothetical protein